MTGRALRAEIRFAASLRVLPRRVAWFQWRARRAARRAGDGFSLGSVTRPDDLARLLALARGRRRVVELGTATAWTAISLALADPGREVISYDPFERPEPERYLALVAPAVRARIRLVLGRGADGPVTPGAVDLLYIDSSHERQDTLDEVRAWTAALSPGALIVFDDYRHPGYPGVAEAVTELGLNGYETGTLFVHAAGQARTS